MIKLNHEGTLNYFLKKFEIDNLFDIDLKKHLELHCFNKDELICVDNTSFEYLYFLVDGTAKSYTDSYNNKNNIHNFYTSLSTIGELELFNNSNFDYNVKSLEECICIAIHRDIINNHFMKDIKFLKYFCNIFSNKLSTESTNFININKDRRDIV